MRTFVANRRALWLTLERQQNCLRPGPNWGSLRRSARPRLGTTSHHSPLDAFSFSILATSAHRLILQWRFLTRTFWQWGPYARIPSHFFYCHPAIHGL